MQHFDYCPVRLIIDSVGKRQLIKQASFHPFYFDQTAVVRNVSRLAGPRRDSAGPRCNQQKLAAITLSDVALLADSGAVFQ